MIHPIGALLIGLALVVLGAVLFWPNKGWYFRWLRYRGVTERVFLEDALKHFFDFEYASRVITLESLSGALNCGANKAAVLVDSLETKGFIESKSSQFLLTSSGREYAIRIIRAHRLWERYLSDQTGYQASEWHDQADQREHFLTPEATQVLSEKLGNPQYDPHGDPIPTRLGELPTMKGKPLTEFSQGDTAIILHLEDEPALVYDQLVAEELQPGMPIFFSEVTPKRICFSSQGREHILTSVFANNVSAVFIPKKKEQEEQEEAWKPLSKLEPGEKARVKRFSRRLRTLERYRLMEMGLVEGTLVETKFKSPLNDPIAYSVRGALISLRKSQADLIHISELVRE